MSEAKPDPFESLTDFGSERQDRKARSRGRAAQSVTRRTPIDTPVEVTGESSSDRGAATRLLTPGGEDYGDWLDRSLTGAHRPKDYSAPAISKAHAKMLRQDQMLLEDLGYSRREISVGNMIELAVEIQHEYLVRLARNGAQNGDE